MIEFTDIGKKDIREELSPLFKKLAKVKDQLGYETWQEIRMRLASGHTCARMQIHFLGELRKNLYKD